MATSVKPWIESVHLHSDVLKENAEADISALDLGPLSDGAASVASVYRDPGASSRHRSSRRASRACWRKS